MNDTAIHSPTIPSHGFPRRHIKTATAVCALGLAFLTIAASGCDPDRRTNRSGDDDACAPGETLICPCANGSGGQDCEDVEDGWKTCTCVGTGGAGAAGGHGGTTTTTTTTTTNECDASLGYSDPTCDACFKTNCCEQATSCGSNEQCMDYMSCLEDCTDASCANDCQLAYPTGAALSNAMMACVGDACGDACPKNQQICDSGISMTATVSCVACLSTSTYANPPGCCEEATVCGTDDSAGGCLELLGCYATCSTQACVEQCELVNAVGKGRLDVLDACQNSRCVPPCQPS